MIAPEFRRANADDAPIVLRLMQGAFQEYLGALDPPSGVHKETVDSVRAKMENGTWLIAERDGTPLACVWYEQRGDYFYLGRLSVPPEFRGHGIASALIEFVERTARGAGVTRVRLGARIGIKHLRALYERRGYRVIEYKTHEGYDAPTYVMMEKHLN